MRSGLTALIVLALSSTAFAQEPEEAEGVEAELETEDELEAEDELETELEPEPELPPLDVEAIVRRATEARQGELSGPAYEFCTDPSYEPQGFRAQRFCKMVGPEMEAVCPTAGRTCYKEEEQPPFRLPDGVLYTLLVIALLAIAAGLSWFIVTLLRQWKRREVQTFDLQVPSPVPVTLETLPDTEASILLREAELRLAAGQLAEAALLLHVATLRHLEDAGLISFHPSTTNGEYLRMLRAHRELMSLFRAVGQITDRLRFGDGVVDRTLLEPLLGTARRLLVRPPSRRPSAAGLAAGVLVLLLLPACDGKDASFYSHRPEGLAALPALLRTAGLETKVARRKPQEIPETAGVIVFRTDYLSRDLTTDELAVLLDADRAVIVLDDAHRPQALMPVTSTVSMSDLVEFPRAVDLAVTDAFFCRFDQAWFRESVLGTMSGTLRIPAGFAHTTGPDEPPMSAPHREVELIPLLVYAEAPVDAPKVVAHGALRFGPDGEYKPGCLVYFATSELFSNAALTHEKNAAYAVGLITSLLASGESVLFIDSLDSSGGAGGSVSNSVSNSKMLPLLFHAGLWVAVLFVALGAAFGRLRDPIRTEHKAFLEHAQAVGLYYAASGESGQEHAKEALARLVVAKYRHHVRGGSEEAWMALATHLAERHLLDRQEVLSALSSGLEGGMRTKLEAHTRPLAPVRALAVLSTILAGELHADQKRPKKE